MAIPSLKPSERQVIYPEERVSRRLPENFKECDTTLFAHELEKTIPVTELLEFQKCRISNSGIVFRGPRVFSGCFGYRQMFDAWARPKTLARFYAANFLLRRSRKINGPAILFIDSWSGAYFHWITDTLSRLFTVRQLAERTVVVLPAKFRESHFILASLEAFDIRSILYIEEDEVICCESLIVPTHTAPSGHYREEAIKGVRELLLGRFVDSDAKPASDRIYISRRGAKVRRIVNENEVEELLLSQGFRTVVFEQMTLKDQIRTMAGAAIVVGNHGAGLTNMLFQAPGSKVLEFRKSGDTHNNCYFSLAAVMGLKYFYQVCEPRNRDEEAYSADIVVDIQGLAQNVQRMLADEFLEAEA